MRYAILFAIVVIVHLDCFSQWQRIYPLSGTIMDVAVAEPNYVFLAVHENNISSILKSSNSARTWKKVEITEEELTSIFFTDSLIGYAASYKGVYKTVDGARTWTLKGIPSGFPTPQGITFTSKNIGYLNSGNNKVAKTMDGGETWSLLPNAPLATTEYSNYVSFADDDNGYALSNYKLYKTTTGGDQWTPIDFNADQVYAVNKDVAYANASFSIYKTSNGGDTWESISGWSAGLIHFDNTDEGLFFSNYGRILKTTNGGVDLGIVYESNFPILWHQLSFSGNFGCAIGSDNAILTTTDGGNSWKLNQILPQHGEFRDIHFTSATEGFMIGEYRGVIRTDDNAASFYYDEDHFERDDLYQMAFSDPDTGIFVVTNNYAYTTYDGGKSMFLNNWVPPIIGHLQSNDYEMINSKVIYTVGGKIKVAKSTDGGQSWTPYDFTFSNSLLSIKCLDANTCHAAGMVGMVVSTWDGGEHWKVHNLPLNNDLQEVFLLNSTIGFIGGSQGVILRTADGGENWSIVPTAAQWPVNSFHFITEKKGYAVTQGGEVLRTEDGGINWVLKQGNGIPGSSYYSIAKTFMRDTTYIYGISGGSVYKWKLPPPEPDVVTGIEQPEKGKTVTVFPNPSSGWLYFNSPEKIEKVKVIDMKGVVLRQYDGNTAEIDISDLRSGIYLVQIGLHSKIQISRIIKR